MTKTVCVFYHFKKNCLEINWMDKKSFEYVTTVYGFNIFGLIRTFGMCLYFLSMTFDGHTSIVRC